MNLDAKGLERALDEGRARIMWGDSPVKVREWLKERGVAARPIEELLQDAARERASVVRSSGINDIFTGVVFVVIFGGVFIFLFFSRLRFALVDFSGLFGSGYGIFLILRGIYRLMEGGSYQGSISDLDKDD